MYGKRGMNPSRAMQKVRKRRGILILIIERQLRQQAEPV